jgi:UPF0755 protein
MARVLKAVGVIVILVAVSVGGAAWVGYRKLEAYGQRAFLEDPKAPVVRLRVPKGASARQVASLLERDGVIRSARQFYWYVRVIQEADHLLRPGEYDLTAAMTPLEIMQKVVRGEVVTYRVTVPEGSNLADIARIMGAAGLASEEEVLKLCRDKAFARALGVPDSQDHLEGYLFPDTYRFPSGTPAKDILRTMNARLQAIMTPEIVAKGRELGLEPHQVLTLASIVEKETAVGTERPMISSVFHNRLRKGMKLQTDPTVIYGIPDYQGNITRADLERVHPYNTYVIPGLPPGPIASPGAAAIQAAVEPVDSKNLFFVSQNNGTHVFCQTLTCHNENVKKWQVDFFRKKK